MTPQTISVEEAENLIDKILDLLATKDGRGTYVYIDDICKFITDRRTIAKLDTYYVLCGDIDWADDGDIKKAHAYEMTLNQILDSAEKEKYCLGCDIFFDIDVDQKTYCQCGDLRDGTEQLKANTPASNLFLFLNQLFN